MKALVITDLHGIPYDFIPESIWKEVDYVIVAGDMTQSKFWESKVQHIKFPKPSFSYIFVLRFPSCNILVIIDSVGCFSQFILPETSNRF